VGYHVWDNISFNVAFALGHTDSGQVGGKDTYASAIELFLRWHFLQRENWTLYTDAGVGAIWFNNPFPRGGTHQNFTPQLGVGLTYAIKQDLHLMSGVRWQHISNATKTGSDRNPGFDAAMVYMGLMLPF
jgi:hypothetical protein